LGQEVPLCVELLDPCVVEISRVDIRPFVNRERGDVVKLALTRARSSTPGIQRLALGVELVDLASAAAFADVDVAQAVHRKSIWQPHERLGVTGNSE